ncbi:putative signal peptidase complex subunit 2 [Bienertia sinuspersici]
MSNESETNSTKQQNPKKANLLDHNSLKHILDESVTEVVKGRGYVEDVRMSNIRLLMGTFIIIIALVAQFYPKNKYIILNGLLQLIIYMKEKNAIMFTYPPSGSYNSTGLVISSKLPRFSDMYSLTIESADPKSISANKPVELTKSVTKWFTKDGVLVEGLFWKDVGRLVDEYNKEPKKNK